MIHALMNKLFGETNVKKENVTFLKKYDTVKKYNAARVYVGTVSGCGQYGDDWEEEINYVVLSGRVKAKRLRPFELSGNLTGIFETFVLYPVSDKAEIKVATEKIILYKYKGIGKSIMYKQRL